MPLASSLRRSGISSKRVGLEKVPCGIGRLYTKCMPKVDAYLGVARGPFLILPLTLVISGAGASLYDGGFSWLHTVIALVGLVALHMAVNIFNEVSDFKRGIDLETEATPFSGGSGTLPRGGMSAATAMFFGIVCSLVGAGAGVYFFVEVGAPMVPLFVVGAVLVLTYTDLLARIGLGEAAAGLGLGALPVLGTALVQDGLAGPAAVAACIPAYLMTFNLLLLNEFPDEIADRNGGRRNLVLLAGRRGAACIYTLSALAVPGSLAVAVWFDALPAVALVAAVPTLCVVKAMRWSLTRPEENPPIPAMAGNVIWNLATNAVLGTTLILAA